MKPENFDGQSERFEYLDGWRGLAIIMVLTGHFIAHPTLRWMGTFGVQLFFVLSGFLMSRILFIKKIPLDTFFVRRLARVVPTFFLFTFAAFIYARTVQSRLYEVPFSEMLSTLVFFRTYYPFDVSIWAEQWPIGHFWSLNIEEHSYMWLAFGVFVFGKSKNKYAVPMFLAASVFASIMFRMYYKGQPDSGGSNWSLYSQCGAYGLIASACYRVVLARKIILWPHNVSRWMSLVFFGFSVLFFIPDSKFHSEALSQFLLAISINHLDSAPDFVKKCLSSTVLCWFGVCSFSIYLWQQPFYLLGYTGLFSPYFLLLAAIGSGALSFYAFENPIRISINGAWSDFQNRQEKLQVVGAE